MIDYRSMRSNYIRPLKFDYVDTNQQQYRVKEIPAKFRPEHDDYQKRRPKHHQDIDCAEPAPELTLEPQVQLPQQPIYEEWVAKAATRSQRKSESVLGCCEWGGQEGELCTKCASQLCSSCLGQPYKMRHCTKCLQRLCGNCKKSLKIAFPEYQLRNYAIPMKNHQNLHFSGCSCPHCAT